MVGRAWWVGHGGYTVDIGRACGYTVDIGRAWWVYCIYR